MAKIGLVGIIVRYVKKKPTKSAPTKPGRARRKRYRGQGRP